MSEVRGGPTAVDPALKLRQPASRAVDGAQARPPSAVAPIPAAAVVSSTVAPTSTAPAPEERPTIPPRPAKGVRPSPAPQPGKAAGKDSTRVREEGRSGRESTTPSESTYEEERRALQAAAAPFRRMAIERLQAMGLNDEDAWLEEFERRTAAGPRGYRVTERTQFGGAAADPGLASVAGG